MNVKSSVPRKKRSGIRAAEQIQLMLIMLPTFVLIFIFCYIPLYGVLIAFQDYVPGAAILGAGAKWVGFRHFADFAGVVCIFNIAQEFLGVNKQFYHIC